ncbi:hypothetical protein DYL61_23475 [Pseudomonas nabeulensis]|uniref:Dermonecrotic toxin N-terminal domain-containing protein n=1 Tax=Pseudomonas nabeulensis TaxID=2293833 RepID=A0A4Z0ART5_9PSED|nr:hypothetical protein DYL61_23475 [Pseudomonas nabeulensis]
MVWQLLSEAILKKYPTIKLDRSLTRVGFPIAPAQLELKSLLNLVLDFLDGADAPNFDNVEGTSARLVDEYLIIKINPREAPDAYPDMALIKQIIVELPWALTATFQNELATYWSEITDTGISRWQWLSDRLMENLRISLIEQDGLNDFERETLDQLVRYADKAQRQSVFADAAVHAYCPELVFTYGEQVTRQLSPALLLERSVGDQTCVLLGNTSGVCERFASVDTFVQTWGKRMAADFDIDKITLNRYEPDGNIFDSHAAALLNQQLENLQALEIPARPGSERLSTRFQHITDPGYYFINPTRTPHPVLAKLRGQLPDWLQQASAVDRIAYRQHSLALASAKKRSHGRTFLSGITDIRTFTNKALLEQMKVDEQRLGNRSAEGAKVGQLQPEDVQLTFIKAAGQLETSGLIDRTTLTLTDLAIKNLVGQPGNLVSITHRNGVPMPDWLTPDYITSRGGLIEQVDIGKTYPQMLRMNLLGDNPSITEREMYFAQQTTAQLPLLALELKLKAQNGLTERGVQYVSALLHENPQRRYVDGHAVVIRELALVRKPGASADVVANMFIIEAQDITVGPHLLYCPLYADPLHEFATRALLLSALAHPGELQASVLTWLSDAARAIYDNGGFHEPHFVRFGKGSDFAVIEKPQPAALATDNTNSELQLLYSNGKLMQYLYGSNARALVDQANNDSTSNRESRWAALMEGAGLMFSTLLLPILRGPAMLTGWLIALMGSASHDIPALNSPDPITRELALVDMLLNVSMVLLQLSSPKRQPKPLAKDIQPEALQAPGPRRAPEQWPQSTPLEVREGTVTLDSDALSVGNAPFDFSFSSARARLTPSQAARLASLRVPRPADLPPAVSSGPRKGLYERQGNWYAQVGGHWYRVETRADNSVVIVFPADASVSGPLLQTDGAGQWSLDLNLRLRGGMPRGRIEAARQLKAKRKAELYDQYIKLRGDERTLQNEADSTQRAMESTPNSATRGEFVKALNAQNQRYIQLFETLAERRDLQEPISPNDLSRYLTNTIQNARKLSIMFSEERLALRKAHPEFFTQSEAAARQILAQKDRYAQFTKQLIDINEQQIEALECQDRYLLELDRLGPPGASAYERLTTDRSGEITVLGVRYLQLQSLKFSLFKNLADFPDELSDILDPLGAQVHTHAELERLELPPNDRLQVLESLNQRYGQAVDALEGQAIVQADALEMGYFKRVQKLIETFYLDTTRELATAIKPDAQPQTRPPKQPLVRQGKPAKKVIKTRTHGTLIGEFKPANTDLAIDHVEVRSEPEQKLLATYTLHDEVWDEVRSVTPTQAPALVTRALKIVSAAARRHLGELDQVLVREQHYAEVSHFPVEIEESLQREAGRYRNLASELKRALERDKKTDDDLLGKLENAALALDQEAQLLRIRTSLALPPTHANLAYLLEMKQVHVARLNNRVAMRGERKDFIQEYAINNNSKGTPVWYAHFHYTNANTPKQSYSVAHLKSIQQRKESYYSLLAKSSGHQRTVEIHRGVIGKALAERWFLPLAP